MLVSGLIRPIKLKNKQIDCASAIGEGPQWLPYRGERRRPRAVNGGANSAGCGRVFTSDRLDHFQQLIDA